MRLFVYCFLTVSFLIASPAFAGCDADLAKSTEHLTVNADGTVSDSKTKLMWKRCPEGYTYTSPNTCTAGATATYTWSVALTLPATFATYTDWRLPNVKELQSIVEEQCSAPAINVTAFPNTPSSKVWANSPSAASGYAWYVDFSTGTAVDALKTQSYGVRLVRDM
uniref:Lcl C-terminal domain-containing protein n=1 Tax=Candidatus Electronema sp. TaxID=2698783 RepID=UPI004056AAD6